MKLIDWKEILSTDDEKHAFVLGLADGFNPLKSPYDASLDPPDYLKNEQHYYKVGRAGGLILLFLFMAALASIMLTQLRG